MAGFKFTAQTVDEAKTAIYEPFADMQALVGIYSELRNADSWAVLAMGAMARMIDAFEEFDHLLAKQGHPITFPETKSAVVSTGQDKGAA